MNKLTAVLLFFFTTTSLIISAPLYNEPVTVTQPDGTVLNLFVSGDEFYSRLHDSDDYTIITDPATGYYVYALRNGDRLVSSKFIVGRINPSFLGIPKGLTDSEEIMALNRNRYNSISPVDMGDAPKTGTINNLVVYIRFLDDPEFTDSLSYYSVMFNNDTTNKNSMYNYFREVSYNTLFVTSTFYPVTSGSLVISYQDPHERNYFKPYDSLTNPIGYTSSNLAQREHALLRDAVNYIASMVPSSLNLDGDNDGKVDNVCFIVYGSPTAWATLLWPHRWALYSYVVNINGKRVYDYNFQIQTSLKSSGVGVLCHEMFHSLGSPDLYHYTSNGISPCYRWDVMDNNRNPPQHMGAHMKMKYGTWISAIPTITAGTYTIKPLTSPTNNAYRINSPYSAIEYFVVEFRRKQTVFENSVPGDGLIIYRINSTLNGNAQGPPDEVYAYRPNGTLTSNGVPASAHFGNHVGRTALNYTTNPTPFLMDGTQGGLNIYDITYQDSVMTFTIGNPTVIRQEQTVSGYALSQNYPNPFNPVTAIDFSVRTDELVTMNIYDISGRMVSVLINGRLKAGRHTAVWNAEGYPSGVYYYTLSAGDYKETRKMVLVK